MTKKYLILALGLLIVANSNAMAADDQSCSTVQIPDQRLDEATIQRIEATWLAAEYRGNVAFLDCLLDPGYSVKTATTGQTRSKAQLLTQVAKNAGKTPDIPPLETIVIINGDFATAHSLMKGHKKSGKPYEVAFVDAYIFRDGVWHALAGFDL